MIQMSQRIEWMSKTLAGVLSFAYYLSLSALLRTIPSIEIDDPITGGLVALAIALSFYPTKETLAIILSRAMGVKPHHISRERQRIAHDLHDTVLQDLHRAQLNLGRLKNQQLVELVALDLQKAITETRAICLDLNVVESPLNEAIQHLVSNGLGELSAHCTVTPQTIQLSEKVEKNIYCIIQEGVSNIAKHAQAERAEVKLDALPDRIHLFIQDDGIGFDPSTVTSEQLGLASIRSRVTELGGTYELETNPGEGTAHWIYIPLK